MTNWRIRDFHSADLDGILHLWESLKESNVEPVYALSEVLASCEKDHAVVAVQGEQVVGAAVGRAAHDQGWIVFLATLPEFRGRGIGTSLLAAVENRMAPHGLNKLSALMPESETRVEAFLGRGFALKKNLRYFERKIPVQRQELEPLSLLGGRILARDLWENVAGMRLEKELLERRLVLPLAEADLADEYGVVPPRAVVLFGPPGTGKTTFAKAIASRLEWPFVEVFPSRLAADPKGLAGALRETFLEIAELEHAVVFIDEVEEIAAQRSGEPPSPLQGVTNELLKIIPRLPRAARPAPGLRHQLHPRPGFGVPAARPVRLRHPDRPAGPAGPGGHVAALHPRCRGGRRRRRAPGGPYRGLLPRGHRVRGPQRLPAGAGKGGVRRRRRGVQRQRLSPRGGPEGPLDPGLPRRDRGHPDNGQR